MAGDLDMVIIPPINDGEIDKADDKDCTTISAYLNIHNEG
jgi:hypothetical protein